MIGKRQLKLKLFKQLNDVLEINSICPVEKYEKPSLIKSIKMVKRASLKTKPKKDPSQDAVMI